MWLCAKFFYDLVDSSPSLRSRQAEPLRWQENLKTYGCWNCLRGIYQNMHIRTIGTGYSHDFCLAIPCPVQYLYIFDVLLFFDWCVSTRWNRSWQWRLSVATSKFWTLLWKRAQMKLTRFTPRPMHTRFNSPRMCFYHTRSGIMRSSGCRGHHYSLSFDPKRRQRRK